MFTRFSVLIFALLASACASQKVLLNKEHPAPDASSYPMGLLVVETLTSYGNYNPRNAIYPNARMCSLKSSDGKTETLYSLDLDNTVYTNNSMLHYYSFKITNEPSRLDYICGQGLHVYKNRIGRDMVTGIPFYCGDWAASDLPYLIAGQTEGIIYLGHLTMSLRPKKDDKEVSAGPVVPLLDQKLSRFHVSTFDMSVTDNYEADIAAFRERYPALKSVEIKKAILKP